MIGLMLSDQERNQIWVQFPSWFSPAGELAISVMDDKDIEPKRLEVLEQMFFCFLFFLNLFSSLYVAFYMCSVHNISRSDS